MFDNVSWPSIQAKLQQLHDKCYPFVDLQFTLKLTSFQNIPFEPTGTGSRVAFSWISTNIKPLVGAYDGWLLTLPNAEWHGGNDNGHTYSGMGFAPGSVIHSDEDDNCVFNGVANPLYKAWYERAQHEIYGHFFYALTGQERMVFRTSIGAMDSIVHDVEDHHRLDSAEALALVDWSKYSTITERIAALTAQIATLQAQLVAIQAMIASMTPVATNNRLILLATAKGCLGIDASPNDVAPDEYGCAETVNAIHKKAFGFEIGGGVSTNLLYKALKTSQYFTQVDVPMPGDIIISPTGYGNGSIPNGHVGIFNDDGKIMSNSSLSPTLGLFEENFTSDSWKARFVTLGGYPEYFFRRI